MQYSTPARYVVRDRLRLAFRLSPVSDFEPRRIANTLQFLDGAAKSTGLEHHVLRNLLMTWYWEPSQWKARSRDREKMDIVLKQQAFDGFYWTLRMLNESMGMCLR